MTTTPSTTFTFSIVGYQTGSIGITGTFTISSYDSSGYLMDKSSVFTFTPTCSSGCKTCNTTNLSSCLSCYNQGTY